ncbi:MAG: hypothetical protein HOW73_12810 [Polyangiaceae bacterium]|nr:hypothetical protein [Polyangiaceae bacterium]
MHNSTLTGSVLVLLGVGAGLGCASPEPRRFPLKDPVWVDDDLKPVAVPCKEITNDDGEKETICRPEEYVSPFAWDVGDKTIFRPMSQFFAMDFGFEAKNVNAMDEVPDSSWFTNRIGVRPFTKEELVRGSCPETMLDPEKDADGSWVIDQGKPNGANPGFRVNIKGVGKFMLKADQAREGEKATGATAIATRIYHAAGWYAACDTVVYVPKRLLSLKPGLKFADNSGVEKNFDQPAMEKILEGAQKRNGEYRMLASRWLDGRTVGPFKYEETRRDDPNDVIDHEDRRDLRGARLIAAWLGHFDSREQNSMTTWHAVDSKNKDASPGYTLHWYLDLGDCFGSHWEWDSLNRRINKSYYFDPGDVAADLLTLGIPHRPWDEGKVVKGAELFAYFPLDDFEPEDWKGGYPNPAFQRMTEHDGAWAARIITRFSDDLVAEAVKVGDYSDKFHTEVLTKALIKRRNKIRERYFKNLSPLADVRVTGAKVCATDLARESATWPEKQFKYAGTIFTGRTLGSSDTVKVTRGANGEVCVDLPKVAKSDALKDNDPERYAVVDITNGIAEGPLRMHLYDLGPKGFKLVGIERPDDGDPTW